MNHKRKRPKNRRAGCLLCKSWKINGAKLERKRPASDRRRLQDSARELTATEVEW